MKKFKSEYTKKLLDYTSLCLGRENRMRELLRDGLPSLEKFAFSINVTRETLDYWAGKKREFSLALAEAKARINDIITDAAAFKLIDPTFVKFLLTEVYGKGEGDIEQGRPFEVNLTVVK